MERRAAITSYTSYTSYISYISELEEMLREISQAHLQAILALLEAAYRNGHRIFITTSLQSIGYWEDQVKVCEINRCNCSLCKATLECVGIFTVILPGEPTPT